MRDYSVGREVAVERENESDGRRDEERQKRHRYRICRILSKVDPLIDLELRFRIRSLDEETLVRGNPFAVFSRSPHFRRADFQSVDLDGFSVFRMCELETVFPGVDAVVARQHSFSYEVGKIETVRVVGGKLRIRSDKAEESRYHHVLHVLFGLSFEGREKEAGENRSNDGGHEYAVVDVGGARYAVHFDGCRSHRGV